MPDRGNIEGLLFDLGGVVIGIDFELALQAWTSWSPLPIEDLRDRFRLDEAYQLHERGEIETPVYFAHLRDLLELDADDSEIAAGWNAIFAGEIGETVDYIAAASNRLPCYAFTNSNPAHQVFWTAAYAGVLQSFRQVFVSSDLGLRKPEAGAFAAIARATGISPGAMLFFDDSEENVIGARATGMQAVHVRSPADVRQALAGIGAL